MDSALAKKVATEADQLSIASAAAPQPAQRPWYKNKLLNVCMFILVVELMERLSYYTFAGTQRNFLMQLGYPASEATAMNAAFSILCYLTPIFGGWLADAYLGRYKTILILGCVYVVGVFCAAGAAYPTFENAILYLFGVFGLVALATGGIKPNVNNFGADQYDITIPGEAAEQEKFFSYFYWSINIGAAVAYGYLTTLATSGSGAIPQEYGFFSAYTMAACFMLIALVVFIIGTPRYTRKLPGGDSLRGLVHYLWVNASKSLKGFFTLTAWIVLIAFLLLSVAQSFVTEPTLANALSYTALALSAYSCIILALVHTNNNDIRALEDDKAGTLTADEAASTLDTVPVLLVVNTGFNLLYNCMNGYMQSQACQMDLTIGSSQINGAFFNVADCLAIIITIPLFEHVVYPAIEKAKGSPITRNQKLVGGMIMGTVGVVICVALEFARRAAPVMDVISDCAPEGVRMSQLSAWYMTIPFFLIGAAEGMINPALSYFSYNQAPSNARSLCQAFNLLASGAISNGFTAVITTTLAQYYTDDLNEGKLEYYYYISIVGAVLTIPVYFWLASKFQEKNYNEDAVSETASLARPSEKVSALEL